MLTSKMQIELFVVVCIAWTLLTLKAASLYYGNDQVGSFMIPLYELLIFFNGSICVCQSVFFM